MLNIRGLVVDDKKDTDLDRVDTLRFITPHVSIRTIT